MRGPTERLRHWGRRVPDGEFDVKKQIVLILLAVLCLSGCASGTTRQETLPPETTRALAGYTTSPETEATLPPTEPAQAPEVVETQPQETQPPEPAQAISQGISYRWNNFDATQYLTDSKLHTRVDTCRDALEITSGEPIGALYLVWYQLPDSYTVSWPGGTMTREQETYLHIYLPLPETATQLTIQGGGMLCQLELFTPGASPEGVQNWQPPLEQADILAFPTHADDDALFFGAAMSYYAVEKGLSVQTTFLVEHTEVDRWHERLDGLWEMGIHNYPVIAPFTDYYTTTLQAAVNFHQSREEDILSWQIEQIRRFRPLVILGHDLEGEYGHGQHRVNAYYLTQAVELAAQADACPQSAQMYGTWDTPKFYLHMYEENQIFLDVTTPLEADPQGRSPYEIAKAALNHHRSQQSTGFFVCLDGGMYRSDCRCWGLFRSLVEENGETDMMAGITPSQWR